MTRLVAVFLVCLFADPCFPQRNYEDYRFTSEELTCNAYMHGRISPTSLRPNQAISICNRALQQSISRRNPNWTATIKREMGMAFIYGDTGIPVDWNRGIILLLSAAFDGYGKQIDCTHQHDVVALMEIGRFLWRGNLEVDSRRDKLWVTMQGQTEPSNKRLIG